MSLLKQEIVVLNWTYRYLKQIAKFERVLDLKSCGITIKDCKDAIEAIEKLMFIMSFICPCGQIMGN